MKSIITLMALFMAVIVYGQTYGIINLKAPTTTETAADVGRGSPGEFYFIPSNSLGQAEMRFYDGSTTGGHVIATSTASGGTITIPDTGNSTADGETLRTAISQAEALSLSYPDAVTTIRLSDGVVCDIGASDLTLNADIRLVSGYTVKPSYVSGNQSIYVFPQASITGTGVIDPDGNALVLEGINIDMIVTNITTISVTGCVITDSADFAFINSSSTYLWADKCRFGNVSHANGSERIPAISALQCGFSATADNWFENTSGNPTSMALPSNYENCTFAGSNWYVGHGAFLGGDIKVADIRYSSFQSTATGWFGGGARANYIWCAGLFAGLIDGDSKVFGCVDSSINPITDQ